MNALFFGDIHGSFGSADDHYQELMKKHEGEIDILISVGDFGFWPRDVTGYTWEREFDHRCVFVDGNHEDHEILLKLEEPNWGLDPYHSSVFSSWRKMMEHWEYKRRGEIENGILFIGGARSIDRQYRLRGVDWFPEENISYADQERVFESIEEYGKENIHTVVSHDCPASFDVSEACVNTGKEIIDGNRKFLEHIRSYVRPNRWRFGHYHKRMSGVYEGTQWRCLDMIRGKKSGKYFPEDYEILKF